eukprot:CAMPEP_0197516672 /NCGR_PEP_ID=MMETSP1318-20131121/1579_1 /TAXON_ID=552666 /ORGANISM="Partenskyella glossopodia, Strain RCC365" /LENGTH=418 /DNA_ID=CAMNT_0043065589 /DNA_START=62 /DNA_END=1318 /DNA_ORIENTATION=-
MMRSFPLVAAALLAAPSHAYSSVRSELSLESNASVSVLAETSLGNILMEIVETEKTYVAHLEHYQYVADHLRAMAEKNDPAWVDTGLLKSDLNSIFKRSVNKRIMHAHKELLAQLEAIEKSGKDWETKAEEMLTKIAHLMEEKDIAYLLAATVNNDPTGIFARLKSMDNAVKMIHSLEEKAPKHKGELFNTVDGMSFNMALVKFQRYTRYPLLAGEAFKKHPKLENVVNKMKKLVRLLNEGMRMYENFMDPCFCLLVTGAEAKSQQACGCEHLLHNRLIEKGVKDFLKSWLTQSKSSERAPEPSDGVYFDKRGRSILQEASDKPAALFVTKNNVFWEVVADDMTKKTHGTKAGKIGLHPDSFLTSAGPGSFSLVTGETRHRFHINVKSHTADEGIRKTAVGIQAAIFKLISESDSAVE